MNARSPSLLPLSRSATPGGAASSGSSAAARGGSPPLASSSGTPVPEAVRPTFVTSEDDSPTSPSPKDGRQLSFQQSAFGKTESTFADTAGELNLFSTARRGSQVLGDASAAAAVPLSLGMQMVKPTTLGAAPAGALLVDAALADRRGSPFMDWEHRHGGIHSGAGSFTALEPLSSWRSGNSRKDMSPYSHNRALPLPNGELLSGNVANQRIGRARLNIISHADFAGRPKTGEPTVESAMVLPLGPGPDDDTDRDGVLLPPRAGAVVAEHNYYGSRGATADAQAKAEKEDEQPPPRFAQVHMHGSLYSVSNTNSVNLSVLFFFVPLVFLLVSSAALYGEVVTPSSSKTLAQFSHELNLLVTYLATEQAKCADLNALASQLPAYVGDEQKGFYVLWAETQSRYDSAQSTTNLALSRVSVLASQNGKKIEEVLNGMGAWLFLDVSKLSTTRLQCMTSSANVRVMDLYDGLIRQVQLFNGALSLLSTVMVHSDLDGMRALFAAQMDSIANVSKLFLEVKAAEESQIADASSEENSVLLSLPSNEEEAVFAVQAVAAMRTAEEALRYPTDHVAARTYYQNALLGSGITDGSTTPSLGFLQTSEGLYSVGFSSEVEAALLEMAEATFVPLTSARFNDSEAVVLRSDISSMLALSQSSVNAQHVTTKNVFSTSEKVRRVCLIVLMCLSSCGIVYHAFRLFNRSYSKDNYAHVNAYAVQLRRSLLRMHTAVQRIIRLRVEDATAEVRLSKHPNLRSITAEERELYLGVKMLQQLEPYLPLPMRHPPLGVPATAMVNDVLFLKPAVIARTGLVAIRVDFSSVRTPEQQGIQRKLRKQRDHPPQLPHMQSPSASISAAASEQCDPTPSQPAAGFGAQEVPSPRHRTSAASTVTDWAPRQPSFQRMGGSLLTVGKTAADMAALSATAVEATRHTYKMELLTVIGALANARHGRKRSGADGASAATCEPGAYVQVDGDVATVWMNLCEDLEYPNLHAFHLCSALARYCEDNERACPEMVVCCGDGVVGNISSFPVGSNGPKAAALSGRDRDRMYAKVWPSSAFFGDGKPMGQSPQVSDQTAASPHDRISAMATAARRANKDDADNAVSVDLDLFLISASGMSPMAHMGQWLRQLLGGSQTPRAREQGCDEDAMLAHGRTRQDRSRMPSVTGGKSSRVDLMLPDKEADEASPLLMGDTVMESAERHREKVPLPSPLSPPYAPQEDATCLTSFVVFGAIAAELEAVHGLADVHRQSLFANDVAIARLAEEKRRFDGYYNLARRAAEADESVSAVAASAEPPLLRFSAKDRKCTVDEEALSASLSTFSPLCVPVDLVEYSREYVNFPRVETPVVATDKKKQGPKTSYGARQRLGAQNATPPPMSASSKAPSGDATDLLRAFPLLDMTGEHSQHDACSFHMRVKARAAVTLPTPDAGNVTCHVVSNVHAVYAVALPEPDSTVPSSVLPLWMRAFSRYARLSYAAAALEPDRHKLRSAEESQQLAKMVADVRDAVNAVHAGLTSLTHAQLTLLTSVGSTRMMDTAVAVEEYIKSGPSAPDTEADSQGLATTLFSIQSIDAVRFFEETCA